MDEQRIDWHKTTEVSGSIEVEMTAEQAARLFAAYVPPRGEIVGGPLDGLQVRYDAGPGLPPST
jgi:hypothetical protein